MTFEPWQVTDNYFREDMEILLMAARAVCLPCKQNVPLADQKTHEVAPNGVHVFCAAAPINEVMEIRMISTMPEELLYGLHSR